MEYPKGEIGLISNKHTFPPEFRAVYGDPPYSWDSMTDKRHSKQEQYEYTQAYANWEGLVPVKNTETGNLIARLQEEVWVPNGMTAEPLLYRKVTGENKDGSPKIVTFLAFAGSGLEDFDPVVALTLSPGVVIAAMQQKMIREGKPIFKIVDGKIIDAVLPTLSDKQKAQNKKNLDDLRARIRGEIVPEELTPKVASPAQSQRPGPKSP